MDLMVDAAARGNFFEICGGSHQGASHNIEAFFERFNIGHTYVHGSPTASATSALRAMGATSALTFVEPCHVGDFGLGRFAIGSGEVTIVHDANRTHAWVPTGNCDIGSVGKLYYSAVRS